MVRTQKDPTTVQVECNMEYIFKGLEKKIKKGIRSLEVVKTQYFEGALGCFLVNKQCFPSHTQSYIKKEQSMYP